jgi:hypothetical protein
MNHKCLLFCLFVSLGFANEFTVSERLFSTVFDVLNQETHVATISKQLSTFSTTYLVEDLRKNPLLSATTRFFSWGTVADLEGPSGSKIGSIEENLWRVAPWAEYTITNADNDVVLIAVMDFLGSQFLIYHPKEPEAILATMSRPVLRTVKDDWTVKILAPTRVDPPFLFLLAAYQTDRDNQERFRAKL